VDGVEQILFSIKAMGTYALDGFNYTFTTLTAESPFGDDTANTAEKVVKMGMWVREGDTLTLNDDDGSVIVFKVFKKASQDVAPPVIVSSTVIDGDMVDPAPINAGGFRFDFSEDVTGSIRLIDEAGTDFNWIGQVQGNTAMLTAVAGLELIHEGAYAVEIDVADAAGNPLKETIYFVTTGQ
jgi:hypothetical protein